MAFESENTFNQELPNALTLLSMETASVTVPKVGSPSADIGVIEGRVIVEKLESHITCANNFGHRADWSGDFYCHNHEFSNEIVLISEKPFSISAEETAVVVEIDVEPMVQKTTDPGLNEDSNYVEHQRIRFECDTGCDSQLYAKQGYFRGFGKRYAGRNVESSYKFMQSSVFFENPIVLSLRKEPVLAPMLYELLSN